MDLDTELDAESGNDGRAAAVAASDQGAGTLGFSGTAGQAGAAQGAGLTTMAGDAFGAGPTMPMVPSSWGYADEPANPMRK